MQALFPCPRCQATGRAEVASDAASLRCDQCGGEMEIPAGALERVGAADDVAGVRLHRCLACPGTDLFVRKDFPQRLGVTIVVVGFIASSIAWYYYSIFLSFGILFATAGIDVLLYLLFGNALQCYRCGAIYRGVAGLDDHDPFNLEVHERYRQEAARKKQARQQQGTAP